MTGGWGMGDGAGRMSWSGSVAGPAPKSIATGRGGTGRFSLAGGRATIPAMPPSLPDRGAAGPLAHRVAALLADGRCHSGEDLGRRLGVTRAAVAKAVARLAAGGLAVERRRGRGYRLPRPLELLDEAALRRAAGGLTLPLWLLVETDSTNDALWQRLGPDTPSGAACLAEVQRAGRGRRGRRWLATPYRNITLSVAWRFPAGAAEVSGLSLAAGVAVAEALADLDVRGVGLKWPNDVYIDDRKLGGLLVELRGEAGGPCWVVLGLGLNLSLDPPAAAGIDRPWTSLADARGTAVDRNRLAGRLWCRLVAACRRFEGEGLAPFRDRWARLHLLAGRRVAVQAHGRVLEGVVEGADANGALLLRDGRGRVHRLLSGEVSIGAIS